jgi:hypothetical protein
MRKGSKAVFVLKRKNNSFLLVSHLSEILKIKSETKVNEAKRKGSENM